MLSLCTLLLSTSLSAVPAVTQDEVTQEEVVQHALELTLHEPSTGATLKLPDDWTFATGKEGLMAFSEDQRSFILLAAADENFEKVRTEVRALVRSRLDNVVVATSTIEAVNQRGALEGLVTANGTGVSKLDGQAVEFAAMLVKSDDRGVLVMGAWKDAASAKLVSKVLSGLEIQGTAGEAGLEISNARTGASVKIPEGWQVIRTRKGLLATNPSGDAMAILMGWQGDFEKSLEKIRLVLTGWVFKEIKFGEFAVMEASYDKRLGQVVASQGTAVDRVDNRPVDFVALRITREDLGEGAVLFGAWKDEKNRKTVDKLLSSLRVVGPKAKPEPESDSAKK